MGKELVNESVKQNKESQSIENQKGLRREQLAWDKLDNTANLFPVIANEDMTNVYRISVNLTEEVDRVLLQEALNRILPQFSIFRMRLRMGFFWYYFEENTRPALLYVMNIHIQGLILIRVVITIICSV